MRALSSILRKNTTITSLNLKGIGLTDVGVSELSEAIKTNSSLLSINLSSNSFGETGAASLRDALEVNTSLTSLDLSCNALGFLTIDMLRCSCAKRRNHTILRTNGNYVFEEILNAVSHGVGFVLSLIGAFVLMSEAATTYNTDYHFWACVVYSLSLILLFLFSSLFHAFFMMPQSTVRSR